MATKTENGESFPASAYAYVPDPDKPSTWKLRLWESLSAKETARQVGMAAAALSSGGFRGNKADIPSSDLAAVKAKVRAAWKRVNPDKDASEMPAAIKATEDEIADDALTLDEGPSGTDLYVPAPIGSVVYNKRLAKLIDQHIKQHGILTSEDHATLKRRARGHAGGTVAAANRGTKATEIAPGITLLDGDYAMTPMANDHDEDDGWYKLAKNDPAVNYREADTGNPDPDNDDDIDYCGDCRFFHVGTCCLVEGAIDADGVCDLHRDQVVLYVPDPNQAYAESATFHAERGEGRDGTRYMLPRTFTGASEWVQFLPKPGSYSHVVHGKIDLSQDRLQRIYDNFKANTYGQDLPINAEHDQRASGAVGWIRDMRVAPDGSLEIKPEWNDRGKALIDSDRFRYQSAEYFEQWQEPVSGTWHDDVACGMAICTRPHFKENALRPLAASEGNGLLPGHSGQGGNGMSDKQDKPESNEPAAPQTVTLSEDQVREFKEAQDKLRELNEKYEAQQAETVRLTKENRRRKFTELVRGQGGSADGAPWQDKDGFEGAINKLEALAERVGEDDDFFKSYVADKQAEAKRFAELGLTKMLGSNPDEVDGSPQGEYEQAVAAKLNAEPGLSIHKARAQVLAEKPELYSKMIGGR